ncbi:hypothetical protein AVEN_239516-1 [Araneus ventricosus]|uniref:Tc1-like transposase DDE domain-containing protein n=1 Tax=Araneus ventricosus TaxID=182803 RepID=A0A4Y2SF90_ARAVE|nr:hypothetical protein AVEN_239516-1 [Araneus ventricosus]
MGSILVPSVGLGVGWVPLLTCGTQPKGTRIDPHICLSLLCHLRKKAVRSVGPLSILFSERLQCHGIVQSGGASVMVWDVRSWHAMGPMIRLETTLTGDRHFHSPPKSPEMNIIEDIRDALLHAVENRSPSPRTPMDLLTALQDSWCEKPPGCLQTLVETMPRRVSALMRARGGPTRY